VSGRHAHDRDLHRGAWLAGLAVLIGIAIICIVLSR